MAARRGVTLLELLIAISIIGLLFAILAPAVMYSRQASRRGQCLSHLKQMGIAIHAFQSAHEEFPQGSDEKGYSLHVSILPQIDQAPLYDQIQAATVAPEANTARSILIPIYLCPSDPFGDRRDANGTVGTNYSGNFGTGVQRYGYNGIFRHANGWGNYKKGPLRPADIQDGLSNTAMLGEILVGDGSHRRLRTHWETDRRLAFPDELDEFAELCKNWIPREPFHGDSLFRGRPWTWGDVGVTMYNHVLTPNQLSCQNMDLVQEGIYTAASLHSGGVNLLYADGRAEFVSENIDDTIWVAMGSRVSD